jgi:acetyl-CoA/propionyl-CoA carboxylase biotin carboxyl carrier protein
MFGKVLAHGADREAARRRLIGALEELRVEGIPTTAPYLGQVLDSLSFTAGTHDTDSVAREWAPDPATRPAAPVSQAPGSQTPVAAVAGPTIPTRRVRIATDRGPVEVAVYGRTTRATPVPSPSPRPSRESADSVAAAAVAGAPVAPMDATVVAVRVEPGQEIAAGDVVAVLEAMKMEMEIRTEVAGTVGEVLVTAGAPAHAGLPLITLT